MEKKLHNDLAILKLKTPLRFEVGVVQRACLPSISFLPTFKETVVTSGWGLTEEGDIPNKLQVQKTTENTGGSQSWVSEELANPKKSRIKFT